MDQQPQTLKPQTPTVFEIYQYSYTSKKLPGKPPILDAAKSLAAPVQSGTDFSFNAVAT